MNPKLRAELDLIFPLADTLQMRLDVKDKLGGTQIRGEGEFWMELGAVKLLLRPKMMASVVGTDTASVLVKIQKRLWIYLTYFKFNDALYLWVLDANALGLTEGTSLKFNFIKTIDIPKEIRPGVVGHYMRNRRDKNWTPVADADPVDQGRSELPQEESRIAGTPV